jgi:hypothetical protein
MPSDKAETSGGAHDAEAPRRRIRISKLARGITSDLWTPEDQADRDAVLPGPDQPLTLTNVEAEHSLASLLAGLASRV